MTVDYNQDDLCEHIASGKSLVSWCNLNKVGYSTVMTHLANDLQFQEKYARAREHQADYLVDEIMQIADDVSQDIGRDAEGKPVIDGFASQRARLMVDTRKWVASKMRPKKYGDSTQVKHADADGNKLGIANILGALDGRSSGLPKDDEAPE